MYKRQAILTAAVIRSAGQGHIGNAITEIIAMVRGISWEQASDIYFFYIRQNLEAIIILKMCIRDRNKQPRLS